MTLVVHGGQVIRPGKQELEIADVLIDGDTIRAVGQQFAVPEDAQRLDASGHIILPGLLNAHTHAHNNLSKALGDNWTLEDLLNHGPALYGNRTLEEQYTSAAIGAVEMLKNGCTAAYDMFMAVPAPTDEGVEAVVRAYSDVGLRAIVAPAVADMAFYQTVPYLLDFLPPELRKEVEGIRAAPTEELLRLSENTIRRWNGFGEGRIRVGVAPAIPGQCTDQFLDGCVRLASEYGVGIHTHIVETKIQAIYSLNRWGKTLIAHLSDIGMLGPGFVGAHGVWLTEEDMDQLGASGAAVVHNPASNLKLGSGIAPVREMLNHSVTVGLGSDGSMSSDNQNMFEAMRFAAMVGKVRFPHQQDQWIGAQDVWRMTTLSNARLLGMEIGAVESGRKADLVFLRADSVFLRPLNNVLNALVYSESGADVNTVLVGGKVVLQDGRVLTVDEEHLRARAQEMTDRLRVQKSFAWQRAESLAPYLSAACRKLLKTPFSINRYAAQISSNL